MRWRLLCWAALSTPAALACSGSVTGDVPVSQTNVQSPTTSDVRPAPSGRFARLTHEQWENSVRDLLNLPEAPGLSASFPADARTAGFLFESHTTALETDQVLSGAYASAAETLAARVVSDASLLERLLPAASGSNEERARAFIERFGERAFRRPLTEVEVNRLLALYERGTTLYDDSTGFEAGIRVLIETFLQSPHFLYRVELSTLAVGATIPLSDWEVGQRLSYFLVNSIPDAALLSAARAGQLSTPDAVRAQAERLLGTQAARPALVGFHERLFDFEKYATIQPSTRVYPDISAELGESALESSRRFVEDLAFAGGSFADLMTSTRAFVDRDLASVYGVAGNYGDTFTPVNLDPTQRRGILNQVGFLASNATSVEPDPIHRGVFVATRVLCRTIAAPPDGVPPLPPVVDGTNREVVENHTQSSPVCRACHETQINPFGFPFENYDATGAYRTEDNGYPVDATSKPRIDGQPVEVENSVELAEALAESPEAHECFASHLLEYALGRERTPLDEPLIAELTQASLEGAQITELLVQLAQSPAFLSRSTEELP